MLGAICYICKKKKGGDDGVDRDWAASNTSQPRQDDGTSFQYDVEDSHQHIVKEAQMLVHCSGSLYEKKVGT